MFLVSLLALGLVVVLHLVYSRQSVKNSCRKISSGCLNSAWKMDERVFFNHAYLYAVSSLSHFHALVTGMGLQGQRHYPKSRGKQQCGH